MDLRCDRMSACLDDHATGASEEFQRTKRIFDLYASGPSDRVREVDDNVGHSDPPLFLREARQWMTRWLKDDPTPLREETNAPPKETAEALAGLDKLPADAINYKIQNQFTALASLKKPASRSAWERRRAEVLAQLKDKVFRWFPTNQIPFETSRAVCRRRWKCGDNQVSRWRSSQKASRKR